MAVCFLSYSECYRPVMETVRRLLETLEFQVDVFDGPDLGRPPINVVQQRIVAADCIVLLLGPREPAIGQREIEPAHWPAEEGVYAVAKEKPVALFLHPGTRVPESIRPLQTPARFDFWDTLDFAKNFHHVLKHLLDLKRRIELPPGNQPCLFTKVIARNRIQRNGTLVMDIYHEVVARQECAQFHHHIDTGMDKRATACIRLVAPDAYEIEGTLESSRHRATLEFEQGTDREIPYFVTVDPPLLPGERFGYRREFTVNNFFPLKRPELARMADEEGFPEQYKVDGKIYYGRVWDVFYEMESILLSIHFPRKTTIRSKRALAYSIASRTVNTVETERCNSAECLNIEESPDIGERIVSLRVRRPLMNHQYVLLYEPD
jgi:hypothetical protein